MRVKFKIRRHDPAAGGKRKSYVQAYDIEAAEGMSVLEGLLKIGDQLDPSLAFRKSCRSAICGSCAMTINGFSKLACNTQILPQIKKHGEIVIEPLKNHTVYKDLVVDFSSFWGKLNKVTPYLTPPEESPTEEVRITKEDAEAVDDSQKCIMCGCCNGSCNALEIDDNYIAPAALAKSWRFVGDVREGNSTRRLDKLSTEHGMWTCVRCVHCTQYCPKGVKPLEAIEKLRDRAVEAGITDNHGAKHVTSMLDSIKRVGILDEAAMTFKTLGFVRSLGMIPFGFKMQMHGKMPRPLLFPAIDGIDEVRKICKEREKEKAKERLKREKKK